MYFESVLFLRQTNMPAINAGIGRGETGGRAYGESLLHS